MKYYDKENQRLIFKGQPATSSFWDAHWDIGPAIKERIMNSRDSMVSAVTEKFLGRDAGIILEGGCGNCLHLASLHHHGYKVIGIEYGEQTVAAVNLYAPELDVRFGDVRKLEFDDGFFAGYWSLGLIEHYWDGFDDVAGEMLRVLEDGGVLFLTFPFMSPLRKLKARLKCYPLFEGSKPKDFYQFALDHKAVIDKFESIGFTLVKKQPFDGIKGCKSEIALFRTALKGIYSYRGHSSFIQLIRRLIDLILTSFSAHTMLLVLKKAH